MLMEFVCAYTHFPNALMVNNNGLAFATIAPLVGSDIDRSSLGR